MKTLVLGLGNPILRDDAIGLRVVDALAASYSHPDVTLRTTSLAGVHLLDLLAGFDRAILVDAVQSGGRVGEVRCLGLDGLPGARNGSLPHYNVDIPRTLSLGRALGLPMPQQVHLVAVEAGEVTRFGEGLSPQVERAIPEAVGGVLGLLQP